MQEIAETGWLPVPLFCAGGVATPADAALVMQLGAEAVFVGSGIFKSETPPIVAKAIVEATTHFRDADILAKVSRGLGKAMPGLDIDDARREAGRPGLVSLAVSSTGRPPGGWWPVAVGVLALQGAFAAHARVLAELGADAVEVRTPTDLDALDALVMPGRRVHHHVDAARVLGPVRPAGRAPRPTACPCSAPVPG